MADSRSPNPLATFAGDRWWIFPLFVGLVASLGFRRRDVDSSHLAGHAARQRLEVVAHGQGVGFLPRARRPPR